MTEPGVGPAQQALDAVIMTADAVHGSVRDGRLIVTPATTPVIRKHCSVSRARHRMGAPLGGPPGGQFEMN